MSMLRSFPGGAAGALAAAAAAIGGFLWWRAQPKPGDVVAVDTAKAGMPFSTQVGTINALIQFETGDGKGWQVQLVEVPSMGVVPANFPAMHFTIPKVAVVRVVQHGGG